MKVYHNIDEITSIKNPVLTIGSYDGVHIGHKKIISHINEEANKIDGESVIITFSPHPRYVINPSSDFRLLSTDQEKIQLLAEEGVDHLIVIPFSKEFADKSAEDFIHLLVDIIKVKKVVIGYDHHFGKGRKGDFNLLEEYGQKNDFTVEAIPQQIIDDIGISSSEVRNQLNQGNPKQAHDLIGRPYTFQGIVGKGKQLGNTIGYPTANVMVNNDKKLIPAIGSYSVLVQYQDKVLKGMMNIGNQPTFPNAEFSIEINLFDFNEDIYGEYLQVYLIDRLREEIKFNSADELKDQLGKDKEQALQQLEGFSLIF